MTGEGRRRVAALRQQLNALRTSGLDILAVRSEVNRIAGEFAHLLDTTIVGVGRPASRPGAAGTASVTPGAGSTATPSSGGTTQAPAAEPSDAEATPAGAQGTEPPASATPARPPPVPPRPDRLTRPPEGTHARRAGADRRLLRTGAERCHTGRVADPTRGRTTHPTPGASMSEQPGKRVDDEERTAEQERADALPDDSPLHRDVRPTPSIRRQGTPRASRGEPADGLPRVVLRGGRPRRTTARLC